MSARAAELEKERKERDAGAERVRALEGELAGVKGERDARAKEKGEKQKRIEELKKQMATRPLSCSWREREGFGVERVKGLVEELAGVKGDLDALVKEKEKFRRLLSI